MDIHHRNKKYLDYNCAHMDPESHALQIPALPRSRDVPLEIKNRLKLRKVTVTETKREMGEFIDDKNEEIIKERKTLSPVSNRKLLSSVSLTPASNRKIFSRATLTPASSKNTLSNIRERLHSTKKKNPLHAKEKEDFCNLDKRNLFARSTPLKEMRSNSALRNIRDRIATHNVLSSVKKSRQLSFHVNYNIEINSTSERRNVRDDNCPKEITTKLKTKIEKKLCSTFDSVSSDLKPVPSLGSNEIEQLN